MGSNTPITERINNVGCHTYTVSINSAELKRYLAQYNLVPNKTAIYIMPLDNIPPEFQWDLVRGLMDADGCIHIRKNESPIATFVSANKHCTEQMRDLWQTSNKILFQNNAYKIAVEGQKAISILNNIYKNSIEKTRLDRKYNLYRSLTK